MKYLETLDLLESQRISTVLLENVFITQSAGLIKFVTLSPTVQHSVTLITAAHPGSGA